jgi:hypothetical protein
MSPDLGEMAADRTEISHHRREIVPDRAEISHHRREIIPDHVKIADTSGTDTPK